MAVTRNQASGQLRIFVDGVLDAEGSGPTGDVSYRDGRSTSNPKDRLIVIGAEKHDFNTAQFPSYSGLFDELRISNSIRYTTDFVRPTAPFNADANTAALYHFNEGPVGACQGTVVDSSGASGGPSSGSCRYGGNPAGPLYSAENPFAQPPVTPTHTFMPVILTNTPTLTRTVTLTLTRTSTRGAPPTAGPSPTRTRTSTPTKPVVIPPPGDNRIFLPAILGSTGLILVTLVSVVLFGFGIFGIINWISHHRSHPK